MPETRDFAALPTSWALTIWDALPLFLSFEVAFAVALVALAGPIARNRLWRATGIFPLGGLAYLAVFDTRLAAVLGLCAVILIAVHLTRWPRLPESDVPNEPLTAIRIRGGSVIGSVAVAGAVAAVIKILLTPALSTNSSARIMVALAGAALTPVPLGATAIPALAIRTATGSLPVAAVWIVVATARPLGLKWLAQRRRSGKAASTVA